MLTSRHHYRLEAVISFERFDYRGYLDRFRASPVDRHYFGLCFRHSFLNVVRSYKNAFKSSADYRLRPLIPGSHHCGF